MMWPFKKKKKKNLSTVDIKIDFFLACIAAYFENIFEIRGYECGHIEGDDFSIFETKTLFRLSEKEILLDQVDKSMGSVGKHLVNQIFARLSNRYGDKKIVIENDRSLVVPPPPNIYGVSDTKLHKVTTNEGFIFYLIRWKDDKIPEFYTFCFRMQCKAQEKK